MNFWIYVVLIDEVEVSDIRWITYEDKVYRAVRMIFFFGGGAKCNICHECTSRETDEEEEGGRGG